MSDEPARPAESVATYWCPNCNRQGLATPRDGEICRLCGEEAWEPFREGWDESD